MVISERFKAACRRARDEDGYTHVVSVAGKYRATTYVHCWSIGDLLAWPNGTHLGGRMTPRQGMWTGHMNTRHLWMGSEFRDSIYYQDLMRRYASVKAQS